MSEQKKLLPIRVMLYDFDLHDSNGRHETVGWKVRVYAPDGVEAEGGLMLDIPQARTDICDAVEVAVQHPDFDLPGTKELRPPSEVDRLRALIKQAEYANKTNGSAFCPWCGAEDAEGAARHADCPAFTPDGQVR